MSFKPSKFVGSYIDEVIRKQDFRVENLRRFLTEDCLHNYPSITTPSPIPSQESERHGIQNISNYYQAFFKKFKYKDLKVTWDPGMSPKINTRKGSISMEIQNFELFVLTTDDFLGLAHNTQLRFRLSGCFRFLNGKISELNFSLDEYQS